MDYAKMISNVYAEYVPVEVVNEMLTIAQLYPVAIGGNYFEYTPMSFTIDGNGRVVMEFRDRTKTTYKVFYNRRRQLLKVTTGHTLDGIDTIKVGMGDYIFSTIMLALKSFKRFHPVGLNQMPVSEDFKDYMIPARLVVKMLDTINTDIDILPTVTDTSIVSLTKSMAADEHYHFIESRLNCHETNVYTYHVGSYVATSRPADNVPEQWVHVKVVKCMLQEYKLLLASKQAKTSEVSTENLTVNVNVTVE